MTIQGKDENKSQWIPGCFLIHKPETQTIKGFIINSFIQDVFDNKVKKEDNKLFIMYDMSEKLKTKEPVKDFSILNRLSKIHDKRYQW